MKKGFIPFSRKEVKVGDMLVAGTYKMKVDAIRVNRYYKRFIISGGCVKDMRDAKCRSIDRRPRYKRWLGVTN